MSHIALGTHDMAPAGAVHDANLPLVGWTRLALPAGKPPASEPEGAAVAAFHATALRLGGTDEGAPGLRPQNAPDFYAACVRDRDGNKLQAVCYCDEG